jgi:SNF2 family DNA or RNA helicase
VSNTNEGKTIQTIAFISAIMGVDEESNIWFFGAKKKEIPPVLVVMPASVLNQWIREINKVTQSFSSFIVSLRFSFMILTTLSRCNDFMSTA